MKTPRFLGWYAVGLLVIIILLISWCSQPKQSKVSNSTPLEAKPEKVIVAELDIQESIEHIQDSIFAAQQAIKSKQHKLPRTSQVFPKRSEMDSNSTFKVEGSKVTSDTNAYDSVRRLLIYKELLNDSLIEATNDLKFEVLKERMSRFKSDSAFKALLALKDEEIDSLSKQRTHKLGNNAKWFLRGFVIGNITGFAIPK